MYLVGVFSRVQYLISFWEDLLGMYIFLERLTIKNTRLTFSSPEQKVERLQNHFVIKKRKYWLSFRKTKYSVELLSHTRSSQRWEISSLK